MNVLMVGLSDAAFFESHAGGNTGSRLRRYLDTLRASEPDSTLVVLIFTQRRVRPAPCQDGLWLIPVRAPRVQLFPLIGLMTVFRLRQHLQPDVVTAQDPLEVGLFGLILKWVFRAPLEVQIHFNLFSPYWLREHRLWNRARSILARLVLAKADGIRVVSSNVKRSLVDRWGFREETVSTIPVPVFWDTLVDIRSSDGSDERSDPSRKTVLFVGRVCSAKNLPGLFSVVSMVAREVADVDFLVIGPGTAQPAMKQRAAALGVAGVRLIGGVPHSDLVRYYRRASVLLLPSLHEGLPRVVVEAYLASTPAVATKCGGPEDIIVDGETGFLVDVGDLAGFAERVVWLLDHPEEARRMGRRGQEYVRRTFRPEDLVERMTGQWKRLAERSDRKL